MESRQGFELGDYYIPPVADYFHYTDEFGNQATGLYQKEVPQFGKAQYHFFKQAVLDPDEGPLLVVQGETSSDVRSSGNAIKVAGI